MKFRIETARDFENNRKKLPMYIKTYMNRHKLTYEDAKNLGVFVLDIDADTPPQEISDLMMVLRNCPSIYIVVINIAGEDSDLDQWDAIWKLVNDSCYRRHHYKRINGGYMEVWSRPPIRFNSEIL